MTTEQAERQRVLNELCAAVTSATTKEERNAAGRALLAFIEGETREK